MSNLNELVKIALETTLESMAKKNGTTIENARLAILSGNKNAVSQFKKFNSVAFETFNTMGLI